MPLMPIKIKFCSKFKLLNSNSVLLIFSMHNGKFTGPHDGFSTSDWDYQRMMAVERSIVMRVQGFIHPATLVPDELEYNKGYEAKISKLNEKFK